MAIAFTYTEATNIVVVTGGTSGTPATFADFVTADRAGTATLLVSVAGESAMTLTYPIRPVEDLALQISFVVTSKSEDGNIYVTGTDWKGDAQTENITANSDDTYVSVGYYATITQIDCTVAVDGAGDDWGVGGAGDIQVTQPQWGVIWDKGLRQYQLDCYFNIGNGSDTTYFAAEYQHIVYKKGFYTYVTNSAELRSGVKLSANGVEHGCSWMWEQTVLGGYTYVDTGIRTNATGTLLAYGSTFQSFPKSGTEYSNPVVYLTDSDSELIACILMNMRSFFVDGAVTPKLTRVESHAGWWGFTIKNGAAPATFEDCRVYNVAADGFFLLSNTGDTTTVTGPKSQENSVSDIEIQALYSGSIINIIDATYDNIIGPSSSGGTPGYGQIQYTCNITVADKDGTLLDGVEVLCEDEADATAWTTTTGDTDTGKIDEQIITTQKRQYPGGGALTLTEYNPHKFTLSKAGYETLILENITVDAPIAWHLELQSPKQPPAPWQEGLM